MNDAGTNDAGTNDAQVGGSGVRGAAPERGRGSGRPVGGPVTVEIEDIVAPATFSRVPDAVAALWEALRVLPLGWTQYEAYRYFLGPGAVDRIEESLRRDGELSLTFRMSGRLHSVRVTPAG